MSEWMGWHFSDESECLRYGDGRKIAIGVTHVVNCIPVLCEVGLHASARVSDALKYAPGPILWRVSLSGTVVHGDDKSCATKRTYHARIDTTDILRAFARKCALDVIHLWDAPSVVREYLETGNEELRDAAWDAATAAAMAAAWDAAWDAACDAAMAAAMAAARDAARAAAMAARAARDAAWDAATAAAIAAARDAAWDAARAATMAAARASAGDAQRDTLEKMVIEALGDAL